MCRALHTQVRFYTSNTNNGLQRYEGRLRICRTATSIREQSTDISRKFFTIIIIAILFVWKAARHVGCWWTTDVHLNPLTVGRGVAWCRFSFQNRRNSKSRITGEKLNTWRPLVRRQVIVLSSSIHLFVEGYDLLRYWKHVKKAP